MYEWATNIIDQSSYLGVFLSMVAENIFPPIPSELVMIFSGAASAEGDMNIFLVVVIAALGSAIGLIPWYYLGAWISKRRIKKFAEKYGRFLTVSADEVDSADQWFEEHGKKTVLIGRFLPGIRTLVAIPAAIARMNLGTVLFYAFIGSLLWDGAFAGLGYYVGENSQELKRYVDIASYSMLGIIIGWYIYRVITFKNKKES